MDFLKRLVRSSLNRLGYEVHQKSRLPIRPGSQNSDMNSGFKRCSKLGLDVRTVIDVGAAMGKWSMMAKPYWPSASYVLLEPLAERREELETLVRSNANFYYVSSAAGKEKGVVHFGVSDDLDGSGVASEAGGSMTREVNVTTISDEVKRLNLPGPFLIKLDTHGFEIPILEGCKEISKNISAFIIECYGFQIAKNSLLFWEMCRYMDSYGFRLFDIVDIMHREKDDAFWQCDAFFIKKDHPIFSDNTYR